MKLVTDLHWMVSEDTIERDIRRAVSFSRASKEKYRKLIETNIWSTPNRLDIQKDLRGKNLTCWCRLDMPCHADVLLEIANLE